MRFSIYRYNPETHDKPYMQDYELAGVQPGMMLLDALEKLREQDASLTFRRSCGEGICGSDAININGRNGLACITPLAKLKEPVTLRPLPGRPVIRDLVVDLSQFYQQYRAIKPWLIREDPVPEVEFQQLPEERARLDGLYECILCACCSTACPSWWWNPEKFRGPAALLWASRFLEDDRDQAAEERLLELDDAYKLFRCHTIMNCADVCPKDLNPAEAISRIRQRMIKDSI